MRGGDSAEGEREGRGVFEYHISLKGAFNRCILARL